MRTCSWALFALALGASSCTVDDSIVEGKTCILGSTNPDSSCMTGYECRCGDGKCLCVKADSLVQTRTPPSHVRPPLAAGNERDPSLRFLRQLGLEP